MDITYTTGPRYINGVNIDKDVNATVDVKETTLQISDPVTGLGGAGYAPGQKNRDGGDL